MIAEFPTVMIRHITGQKIIPENTVTHYQSQATVTRCIHLVTKYSVIILHCHKGMDVIAYQSWNYLIISSTLNQMSTQESLKKKLKQEQSHVCISFT